MYHYCIAFQRIEQREDVRSHLEQFCTKSTSKRSESEWVQRKKILDEHWMETRCGILACCIAANQIPHLLTRCDSCEGILAKIRCTSCLKLLCHECDQAIHCQQPFHDRQVWVKGYYEGIGNRTVMQFDGKLDTAGIVIFVHLFLYCLHLLACSSLEEQIYLVNLYSRCMNCSHHHPLLCNLIVTS